MEQPPRDVAREAVRASRNSPCRSKRGAVVFDDSGILSIGWNFRPGTPCDGSAACKALCRHTAVHAEQLALLSLDAMRRRRPLEMLHVKTTVMQADPNDPLTAMGAIQAVPSGPPSCVQCSKLMLALSVRGMWLLHEDGWRRYPMDEFHAYSLANDPSLPILGDGTFPAADPSTGICANG